MEGNRLFWVIVLYVIATQILPHLYQFLVVMKQMGMAQGVMG